MNKELLKSALIGFMKCRDELKDQLKHVENLIYKYQILLLKDAGIKKGVMFEVINEKRLSGGIVTKGYNIEVIDFNDIKIEFKIKYIKGWDLIQCKLLSFCEMVGIENPLIIK